MRAYLLERKGHTVAEARSHPCSKLNQRKNHRRPRQQQHAFVIGGMTARRIRPGGMQQAQQSLRSASRHWVASSHDPSRWSPWHTCKLEKHSPEPQYMASCGVCFARVKLARVCVPCSGARKRCSRAVRVAGVAARISAFPPDNSAGTRPLHGTLGADTRDHVHPCRHVQSGSTSRQRCGSRSHAKSSFVCLVHTIPWGVASSQWRATTY